MAFLWAAIVNDTPTWRCPPCIPLGAYQHVKDVADPTADWKNRLMAAFRRDIHALHRVLGDGPSDAKLVSLDLPDARALGRARRRDEQNRLLPRVRSKLRYESGGAEHAFEVQSMILWRGPWCVVHLS